MNSKYIVRDVLALPLFKHGLVLTVVALETLLVILPGYQSLQVCFF